MLSFPSEISFDRLLTRRYTETDIRLTIARLDKIHPEVSGNKLFKLHYFVEACLQTSHKTMLTFGGAYSNHLVAAAFRCKEKGIKCIGVIRGERPEYISHTLLQCDALGMKLYFISREIYSNIEAHSPVLKDEFGEFTLVPEGGYAPEGAKGAALIYDLIKAEKPTHICTATGTATTLAGLLLNKETEEIIAVPVIKNMTDIPDRIEYLTGNKSTMPVVFGEYHFSGYAKYNSELIGFMNEFYAAHQVPLDFVYTAKMMFAITDKIKNGYFKKGSHIVCLHTGGLQGNESLSPGTLIF